jgi:predicted nucleic acid-binding protein
VSTILIDSNVLLYAYDQNEPARHAQALSILKQLELMAAGQLSVQSLAEFISVATRRLKPPLNPGEALKQAELLADAYPVLDLTVPIVLEAVRGVRDHQMAYYDAQIWATAKLNQIPVVFSEDLPSSRVLEGVRFVNPFAQDFVLENWV